MNEEQDVKKVYLVNPPIQDPWRTRQEYIDEQNQSKWQFRLTIAALVVSIIASLAAVASAYAAIKALNNLTPTINAVPAESKSNLTSQSSSQPAAAGTPQSGAPN
ncbi:hypothetical protein QP938_05900 [Porticoccaceae bacterium LTM1]|nr:hypothetical protein QP938_05900 [Porticoccaceae bacterium LTM1]